MKAVVERNGVERSITVEPSGAGYTVLLGRRQLHVEGQVGGRSRVILDGRPMEAAICRQGGDVIVELEGRRYTFRVRDARIPKRERRGAADDARGELHAPMPGLVIEVLASVGDDVDAGRPLVVVEAMKMQNAFVAPLSGRVTRIDVKPGMPVESGQLLLSIVPGEN